MSRNFSRQPVAIAPGLTTRHRYLYGAGECFALEGNTQPLSEAEAKRLRKSLDVWLDVIDFKRISAMREREQANAEG